MMKSSELIEEENQELLSDKTKFLPGTLQETGSFIKKSSELIKEKTRNFYDGKFRTNKRKIPGTFVR